MEVYGNVRVMSLLSRFNLPRCKILCADVDTEFSLLKWKELLLRDNHIFVFTLLEIISMVSVKKDHYVVVPERKASTDRSCFPLSFSIFNFFEERG